MEVKSLSRVRLCDLMAYSLPSSSVHGIFQARILEWVAIQLVKNPPAMRETWVRSLSWEHPLEKGKVIHSSILA